MESTPQPATGEQEQAGRLDAVSRYGSLAEPREPALERIVRLAKEVFGSSEALVTLVGETEQEFLAGGLDGLASTPKEHALCATAILQDEVMVVLDASSDPRFASNPLVTAGPKLRFYAGAPLRTPDGFNLGTLCLVSQEPRNEFTESDRRRLLAMAGMVVTELELKLQVQRAEKAVAERELLIREVRARVENGLGMVRHVLALQAKTATSVEARKAFEQAASRVLAIAAVHRRLYQDSTTAGDGADYLKGLLPDLREGPARGRYLTIDADADLRFESEVLLPLGLAATELVARVAASTSGAIKIELRRLERDAALMVSGEAGGFRRDFDPAAEDGDMGMRIVVTFATPGGLYVDPADRRRLVAVMPTSAARRHAARRGGR